MSLYTYFEELDAVSKVRYKKKLSVLNIPECPYRFPEGVWENNPTKWPDLEWGDLYSYLVESPGIYLFMFLYESPVRFILMGFYLF